MTTFKFTPACCCGSVEHECGDGYGLQSFTSTSMTKYSLFMMGWDGSSYLGLQGYPGDPWFQTFVHENGDVEYRSGVYLPNGTINPTEARIYPNQFEGEDIVIGGFQNCKKITFYSDFIDVAFMPFENISFEDSEVSPIITPDPFGKKMIYINIPRRNLNLLDSIDLSPYIRDQSVNHYGTPPAGVTLNGDDGTATVEIWRGYRQGLDWFDASNNPYYESLKELFNYSGYFWNMEYPVGEINTIYRCPCRLTDETVLSLLPDDVFLATLPTLGIRFAPEVDAPSAGFGYDEAREFVREYNRNPTYLPDLTETSVDGGRLITHFGFAYQALIRVFAWYANYLGN